MFNVNYLIVSYDDVYMFIGMYKSSSCVDYVETTHLYEIWLNEENIRRGEGRRGFISIYTTMKMNTKLRCVFVDYGTLSLGGRPIIIVVFIERLITRVIQTTWTERQNLFRFLHILRIFYLLLTSFKNLFRIVKQKSVEGLNWKVLKSFEDVWKSRNNRVQFKRSTKITESFQNLWIVNLTNR